MAPVAARPASGLYFDLALDEARERIYATDEARGSLDVISMPNLEVIDRIIVGRQPRGIDLSTDGNQLAVALQGEGEVALIDLDTLTITQRLVPYVKIGPNWPFDVEYGRPGRLYTVGNPGPGGIDYLHVFDTDSYLEIARSGEDIRYYPHLAITSDGNKLFIGESQVIPQHLYRFDISGDQPVLDAQASEILVTTTGSICVTPSGQVVTSGQQIWTGDLSNNTTIKLSDPYITTGYYVECDPVKPRAYFTGFDTEISVIDTSLATNLISLSQNYFRGPGRLSISENRLYVSTDMGIQALDMDRLSVAYLPQVDNRHCPRFSDLFDDPESGWRVAEDEEARSEYSNGEFRILSKNGQREHLYRAPACGSNAYVVDVNARWVSRPGDSYGLIFDITGDYESYYRFEVNSVLGTFRLVRVNGGSTQEIVPPTSHPAIHTGMQANHLSVWVELEIGLQVNDTTVFSSWLGDRGDLVGVGVFSSGKSNSEAGFDNFDVMSFFSRK